MWLSLKYFRGAYNTLARRMMSILFGRGFSRIEYRLTSLVVKQKITAFRPALVIDPVLSYSTFLGGGDSESASSIAVDSQGSAYVTGFTEGGTFPTTAGAFKTTSQGGGAFVSKLDPTGSTLVYSTYISTNSSGRSIAVDAAGNAYVTGNTRASDFPIVNGLKTTITSQDAFVTKLRSGSKPATELPRVDVGANKQR
jgi:hypothetical protein